jgi:hypothetical protein
MRRVGDCVCRRQSKVITEEKDIIPYFNIGLVTMHSPENMLKKYKQKQR